MLSREEQRRIISDLKSEKIKELPKGFKYEKGVLYLRECNLKSLPEGFSFRGKNLFLGGNQLTCLPESFSFSGNKLDLRGNQLTRLTENFSFKGKCLDLSGNQLTHLPENFSFNGIELYLRNNQLTHLPNVMTTTKPQGVIVHVENSGLSLDLIERIQRENLYPGFRFYFNVRVSHSSNLSVSEVLSKFSLDSSILDIYSDYHQDLIRKFLNRLLQTAEYQNLNTRESLVGRVQCLLSGIIEEDIFDEISNGMTSCGDRVILAFDNIEAAIKVKTFREEHEYRAYAKTLAYLGEVDKIAFTYASTLRCCDTIEVILAFRTELAKRFDLQISTQMLYRGCAFVTNEKIHELADSIGEIDVDTFMASWDPYQKFLRSKRVIPYEDLPKEVILIGEHLCSISSDVAKYPMIYNGHIYDYDMFFKNFVSTGVDPFDRSPIVFPRN